MKNFNHITGLVPAVFTPMREDGSLNLEMVPRIADHLISDGVSGLYVCGSTGEGVSMTREERQATTEAFVQAAAGRVPVIVQVGHNSLAKARLLAEHAQQCGADAISAIPPNYFKPETLDLLLACLEEIVSGAPDLPFYYYHIPRMTGIDIDLVELLRQGGQRLPTLVGVKYSNFTVYELQACVELDGGRFNMLFGSDEMLLSGLCGGAHGAVGSTYNFAAPLYNRVIQAFKAGDLLTAQHYQGRAVQMVRVIMRHGGHAALKAMMQIIGLDCGPCRLPLPTFTPEQVAALRNDLEAIGFFEWGR